jgi:ribosome maturation factor RimP
MNSLEQKIFDISLEPLKNLGCSIVTIKAIAEKKTKLYFTIEKIDNSPVNLLDCRSVSRHLETLLQVEEILIDFAIEVSSAGVERPLFKLDDYKKYIGKEVKIHLIQAVENKKLYTGIIEDVSGENIILKTQQPLYSSMILDFTNIKKANLVFSDELFRQLIKQSKKD